MVAVKKSERFSGPSTPETLLADFARRNPACKYSVLKNAGQSSVSSQSMVNQLLKRIKNPYLIDQGYSSLCGPNVIMRCLAETRPIEYVSYVLDLYEFGEARIGNLVVKPSLACLNASNKRVGSDKSSIIAADWIALASLRDSENGIFDYQSTNDQVSGITLPSTIEHWFKKIGYNNVVNRTNLFWDKGIDTLVKAQKAYASGHHVCLFINSKLVSLPFSTMLTPNHWVVLSDNIKVDGKALHTIPNDELDDLDEKQIEVKVSTWGQRQLKLDKRNAASKITADEFTDYFFGYVAAKKT